MKKILLLTINLLLLSIVLLLPKVNAQNPIQHLSSIKSPASVVVDESGKVTQWTDLSGNNNHATPRNGDVIYPSTTTSAGGQVGLDFGTERNYLRLFNNIKTDKWLDFLGEASGNSGFAIFVAFQVAEMLNENNDLVGNNSSVVKNGFGIRYKSTGEFEVYLGGVSKVIPGAKVEAGESFVVACNYNKTTKELTFWDSKNQLTHTLIVHPIDFTIAEFNIGSANNNSRCISGSVGEVKVYDEALSAEYFKEEYSKLRDYWCGVSLPIEVIGSQGVITSRSFDLTEEQVTEAKKLYLQINNLSYENKVSVSVNNGTWYDLNHSSVVMQPQEKARGGMQHGGFNTIRLTVPLTNLQVGENTFSFRFNHSDAISNGFRVIDFNLLDDNKNELLADDFFINEQPNTWVGPYTDAQSIAEGEVLWREGNLWSNYLEEEQKGFWYGYELAARQPIAAKCADCHTQDGRDLELFSYSNNSIIERAKFHNLTEEEGRKIAAYIRSLSANNDNINRHGRPWNPPYQPGPSLEGKDIEYWAAGAGLEAVLDHDSDMLEYMFPNGINENSIKEYFDADKFEDRTILPLAIQFPDWKHWLPMIHPKDAFNKNSFYTQTYDEVKNSEFIKEGGENRTRNPDAAYEIMRDYLVALPKQADGITINFSAIAQETIDEMKYYHETFRWNYRYFQAQGARDLDPNADVDHWRTKIGKGLNALADDVGQEFAATSLARLMAVKNFEFMQEFNLQDQAPNHLLAEDNPNTRQWFHGDSKHVFEIPAHITGCIDGDCLTFEGQPNATGEYESSVWYHLQSILAGGEGEQWWNGPVDYNYQPEFILLSSNSSGKYDVLRYYHSIASMYQTKTWSGDLNPNDGYGFRIRVQGPWYFFGKEADAQRSQFKGFEPGYWPSLLDEVYPGLGKMVIETLLVEFLEAVKKHDLSTWKRWDGVTNTNTSQFLDPISKSEVIDVTLSDADPIFQDLDPNAPLYADHMYWSIQQAINFGIDCAIIQELIDWSQEAWPNIDWSFSIPPHLDLQLPNNAKYYSEIEHVNAVTSSEGQSPEFSWSINGSTVPFYGKKLPKDFIQPGDSIICNMTSNASCLSIYSVADTMVVPNGISVLSRINNEEWQPINNTFACIGDSISYKLEVDIAPIFWIDAHQIAESGVLDGGVVTEWENKVEGLPKATKINDNTLPTFEEDAFNGKPAVLFGKEGVSSGLKLITASNTDFLEEDWTMFIVQHINTVGTWSNTIGNKNGITDNGFFYRISKNGQAALSGGQSTINTNSTAFPITAISVLSKKDLKLQSYTNGILEHNFDLNPNDILTNQSDLMLGQISTGKNQSRYHDGLIAEVIIFDQKLNDSQRELIEAYLAYKWELEGKLSLHNDYHKHSPFDLDIIAPNNEVLSFNQNSLENTLILEDINSFGPIYLNYKSSEVNGASFEITNDGMTAAPIISYSINNSIKFTGNDAYTLVGDSITLSADINLASDYFWRSPNGEELPLNTAVSWLVEDNGDWEGLWELVITNPCNQTEIIKTFQLDVFSSENQLYQYGEITLKQSQADDWLRVTFQSEFIEAPIITISPLSFNGSDPSTYRIRNITKSSFEIQIREWDYLNQIHNNAEDIFFLAMSPQLEKLGNLPLAKGEILAKENWQTHFFETDFQTVPVVLTNIITDTENKTKVIQLRNVTTNGFEYRLQGQESTTQALLDENIHFIAIENGETSLLENYFDVGRIDNSISSSWTTYNFPTKIMETGIFGHAQTTNETDSYSLRYKDLSEEGVTFSLQEEVSWDTEVQHGFENIGWLRMKGDYSLFSSERIADNGNVIASIDDLEKLLIYPNPVVSQLSIESEKNILSLEIYSITGQLIYSNNNFKNNINFKVNLESMKSGLYILRLNFNDASQKSTKFFKQ